MEAVEEPKYPAPFQMPQQPMQQTVQFQQPMMPQFSQPPMMYAGQPQQQQIPQQQQMIGVPAMGYQAGPGGFQPQMLMQPQQFPGQLNAQFHPGGQN
eukprot:707398_1